MCDTCGGAREAAARAKKSPIGDYSLWFLIDSDGIPDGCDLEQFNKPETDCLLLDTQVNEADADLHIVIDTRRNHSLPILVRNYRRSAQGEH